MKPTKNGSGGVHIGNVWQIPDIKWRGFNMFFFNICFHASEISIDKFRDHTFF